MKTTIEMVAEFHSVYGVPALENPGLPDQDRRQLRFSLLHEELLELSDAMAI